MFESTLPFEFYKPLQDNGTLYGKLWEDIGYE